jgi:hypothetical protein
MATAICRVATLRNGVQSMATQQVKPDNNQLRPELEKIVETIIGLKAVAASTGYMTFKEQRAILDRLTSEDKAAVGRALAKREREQTK